MADITLYNSSQLIEEEWLKLVKKYFPNEDINMLKVGLFGYINEIMSQEIKNNIYHRNFIYDEYLLNTASTQKSIYNFARLNNVDTGNSIPARLSATLAVRELDLPKENISLNTIADNGNIERAVISKNTIFTLNSKNFLLPYDVEIIFNKNIIDDSKYTITANYVIEDNEFPFIDLNTNILKSWHNLYNGERYVYIKIDLFQLERETKELMVTNENSIYNTFYKFEYTGQLSYFNVYYTEDGVKQKLIVLNNDKYVLDNSIKYCYYNLLDEGTLEISFSSLTGAFRPKYGSKLELEIFHSEGSAGNLGSLSGIQVSYTLKDFESSIPMLITPISDCYGGVDKLNLLQLKEKIVNKYLLRNAIVTENDLNYFFNNISRSELINNSELKFIKKRNDVLRKIYSVYCLMRDTNNVVIPTRTIEKLQISANQIKELVSKDNKNTITIPERSLIVYDIEASNYFLVTKELEINRYLNNEKYLVYSIPYLLTVSINEFMISKYYRTYVNEDINLEYAFNNTEIPYTFMINNCSLIKNSLDSDTYKLSLNLITNLETVSDLENIIVRGILKSKSGTAYGYFDFERTDLANLLYEAELTTEKYNTINNGKLNLYNSLYLISTKPIKDENGATSLQYCYIDENLSLEIQVLFKSKYSSYKYGEAGNMPDLYTTDGSQYSSASVMFNNSTIELFKDMSSFVDSTVAPIGDLRGILNQNPEDNVDDSNTIENTGITIQSIPVVEYNYFKNNAIQIYRIISNFQTLLSSNLNKLDCTTELDLKFYNTHGPSKMLYTNIEYTTLNGIKKYKYLNRLDIDLNMNIYLNTYISDSTKEELGNYLANYIESLNSKGVIAISNICKTLEAKYPFINFIEFNSINGDYIQKIMNIEYDDDINYNFVPEFVNVRKGLSSLESTNSNEKKYKYSLTINYK